MKIKNEFIIVFLIYILVSNIYAHEEFLKYNASAPQGTSAVGVFVTTDIYHPDLLHWDNYHIKVHPDFINRAPAFDERWTEADKKILLFSVLNNWDQYDFDDVIFSETNSIHKGVAIIWSIDTDLFPPPTPGAEQTLAFTDIAVQNNKIVIKRTDQVPDGHADQTIVVFDNSSTKGYEWVLFNTLDEYDSEWGFLEIALHEFGHVLGLAHCWVDEWNTVMEEVNDDTRPRPTEEEPYFDDYQGFDIVSALGGGATGIEDGINIYLQYSSYNTNHNYIYPSVQSNFVDEYPYGDYIVNWENWKIYVNDGCEEVLIMDRPSAVYIPTLPQGHNWETDGSGYVIGRIERSGTDNDGVFHTGSTEIKIAGVPNTFITAGTLQSNTTWCGSLAKKV